MILLTYGCHRLPVVSEFLGVYVLRCVVGVLASVPEEAVQKPPAQHQGWRAIRRWREQAEEGDVGEETRPQKGP